MTPTMAVVGLDVSLNRTGGHICIGGSLHELRELARRITGELVAA